MSPDERDQLRADRIRDLREILHEWDEHERWFAAIRSILGMREDATPEDVYASIADLKRRAAP